MSTWYGVGAPMGTPAEVIDKINKEINAGLADPELKERFADWAALRLRARRVISESSSLTKPRSGRR